VEVNLGAYLGQDGQIEKARELVQSSVKTGEQNGMTLMVSLHGGNRALLRLADGEPGRGMDELESLERAARDTGWRFQAFILSVTMAMVYASIATGEATGSGSKIGAVMRNPGFALGRGRRAPDIARNTLMQLSQELPADFEGNRAGVEYTLARVLAKRGERAEARTHVERAIAFLQPMGDCQGMRDARALLATLDAK
jgi:hypothetical protein